MGTKLTDNEIEALLATAPGPLVAELDIFDPDECEAEVSVHTHDVTILFCDGTGQTFPNGTLTEADETRWKALKDSVSFAYGRLFAAAPEFAREVLALRAEVDKMRAAYEACVYYAEWANHEQNRKAYGREDAPDLTPDDVIHTIAPLVHGDRTKLAAFANTIGAAMTGRPYAEVEDSLSVDDLPAMAERVVAALSGVNDTQEQLDLVLDREREIVAEMRKQIDSLTAEADRARLEVSKDREALRSLRAGLELIVMQGGGGPWVSDDTMLSLTADLHAEFLEARESLDGLRRYFSDERAAMDDAHARYRREIDALTAERDHLRQQLDAHTSDPKE